MRLSRFPSGVTSLFRWGRLLYLHLGAQTRYRTARKEATIISKSFDFVKQTSMVSNKGAHCK